MVLFLPDCAVVLGVGLMATNGASAATVGSSASTAAERFGGPAQLEEQGLVSDTDLELQGHFRTKVSGNVHAGWLRAPWQPV